MNENSLKNLKSISERTPEEQAEMRRKAAEGRTKAAKERKMLKEAFNERLKMRTKVIKDKDGNIIETLDGFDLMVEKQINIAINSEDEGKATAAFIVIRDTLGQKPKDEVDLKVNTYEDALKELGDVMEDED